MEWTLCTKECKCSLLSHLYMWCESYGLSPKEGNLKDKETMNKGKKMKQTIIYP